MVGRWTVSSGGEGAVQQTVQSVEAHEQAAVLQAGGNLTIQGDVVAGVPRMPAMESISASAELSRFPRGSDLFIGRSDELDRLDAAVRGSGRAVVVAVHGLGGVGKSTLSARFIHLHADRYTMVWWITADSASTIDSGLADLATALAPQTANLPSEQRTELAVRWLATHTGWLLVLDNLTTPADAEQLLERVRTGTIVITSRQASGWRDVKAIHLDVLSPSEAVELLGRVVRIEWPDADLFDADRLCEELGWLPLAVEQAGAYLAQSRVIPTAYLDLLRRYPARMFTTTAEGGDAQRTMARVWRVTLDRLADTPSAGRLLRRLAWHAPEGIPRGLIITTAGEPEPEVLEALGRLAAYNMITLGTHTIAVHRLVQAVTRTPDPTDHHRQPADINHARDTTAAVLSHVLSTVDPDQPGDWFIIRMTLLHAAVLLNHTPAHSDTETLCDLATHLGRYLRGQSGFNAAIALLTRASHSLERLHGPDHPDTLTSRSNLARAYHSAGDLQRAIALSEATLADRQRVLGPNHRSTLMSRNNLAGVYLSAGALERAIPLLEASLCDAERTLGPDHPGTLNARNNLAGAYLSAIDLERATSLFEVALADYERVLGPDNLLTLAARSSLARAYGSAKRWERAIPLYEAALVDCERIWGPGHLHTLTARHALANAYLSTGYMERAIPLYETSSADAERLLGPDDLNTLTARTNLASAYRSAGDLEKAIPLYEATLAQAKQVLGPDHALTRAIRMNV